MSHGYVIISLPPYLPPFLPPSLLLSLLPSLPPSSLSLSFTDRDTEIPQLFEVPLPHECTVSGTSAHTYNQGLCSRRPCRTRAGECSQSSQCCYEVGQMANVDFTCSDSSSPHHGHVIVMCQCQLCTQLHAEVRGQVLSSLNNEPVVLAAVLVGDDIATFTNQDGTFSFETITPANELSLIFQETNHRELETTLLVRPSLIHEINVLLEYIEVIDHRQKMEAGFDTTLASNDTIETYGINSFLHFPPNAFTIPGSDESYRGSGRVLHSLYCSDKWPSFLTPALDHLVYVDSKGAEFSIQSLAIGSMSIVGDRGESLELQVGAPAVVTVSLRMDTNIPPSRLHWLHLFSYSSTEARWLDHGKMTIIRDTSDEPGTSFYWISLQGKLRELNHVWVVGYPLRLTCWVKVQVYQNVGRHDKITGVPMRLQQSNDHMGRGTFYQHTTPTLPGVGACLKSVCSLGGILSPVHDSGTVFEAVTPSIVNGIIMGNKDEIMIYTIEKQNVGLSGRHPFYPSEEACLQHSDSRSGHFRFVTHSPTSPYQTRPTIMLTQPAVDDNEQHIGEFCYLKVAILDCAAYSDVKIISYGREGNIQSVTFEIASTLGSETAKQTCKSDEVTQLKASCVDFTCGTSVHVSAQSRMERGQTKSCRYWSSTSSLSWTIPPSHNLTSFHFVDQGTAYDRQGQGIYRSLSKELALMKCYSGSQEEPSNTMDPYRGAAVTFTCLS